MMRVSSGFRPFLAGSVALIITIGGLAFAWAASPVAGQQAEGASGSGPRPAETGLSGSDERFRGLVSPGRRVTLGAPLSGMVKGIDVEESDRVEKDQPVARMRDDMQQVVVKLAELKVEREKMKLGEAEIQYERTVDLEKNNAAQAWEVRRKKLQRDGAQVAVQRAEQDMKLERVKLDRYTLRAPFAGEIVRIQTEQGATLQQGDKVLTVVSLNPLEAQLYLPVELYGKLEVGQKYQFKAEAPVNRTLTGRVKTIEPVIDSASETFRCVFEIDNPESKLPAGFTVRLIWPQEPKAAG